MYCNYLSLNEILTGIEILDSGSTPAGVALSIVSEFTILSMKNMQLICEYAARNVQKLV